MRRVLALWFGLSAPVSRRAYVTSGVVLMVLKYALDASLVGLLNGTFYEPWRFLSPLAFVKYEPILANDVACGPDFQCATFFMVVLSLPFLWIGISMSARRAVDAGRSPLLGFLFAAPIANYVLMLVLSLLPSRPAPPMPALEKGAASTVGDMLGPMLAAGVVAVVMVVLGTAVLRDYGVALFFLTPLAMGALAGHWHNRHGLRTVGSTLGVAVGSVVVSGFALMLFAIEGFFCVIMALPPAIVASCCGALFVRAIRAPRAAAAASVFALPILALIESFVATPHETSVTTTIDVAAPPEVVWPHVIAFSDIPEPNEALFATGIAYPIRARIDGTGIGAVRYCEFSTGAFVEPITVWDEPRRLAFDVTAQPDPMREWTFYPGVHPAHLDGFMRSQRGEFVLEPTAAGGTRLTGTTWYTLDMRPAMYWSPLTDVILHAIHRRVLDHIGRDSTRS